MSTKNVLRYTLTLANMTGEFEYDPAEPGTYTTALQSLANLRKKLTDAGVTVEKEVAKPVAVKGEK